MRAKCFVIFLLLAKVVVGALPVGETLWPPGRGPRIALMNPALLANPTPTNFGMELPGCGVLATNNSFSVGFWNSHIAEDDYWDAEEIHKILDRIPASGLEGLMQCYVPIIGLRCRQWAFNVDAFGITRVNTPKEAAEIALLGTRLDKSYEFQDLIGGSLGVVQYSLGYGHPIKQSYLSDLNVGITAHFYQGLLMGNAVHSQGNLHITEELIEGNGVLQASYGLKGRGFGVDLGFSCMPAPRWQVGLVCRQIGATIDWKLEKTKIESFHVSLEGLDLDSLKEEGYLDRALKQESTTIEGGNETLRLPVTLQATAMFVANSHWSFTGETSYLTQESLWGRRGAEIGTGAIFHVGNWALLQSGVILGGPHQNLFMFGTGLRFSHYELDLEFFSRGLFRSSHGVGMGISQRIFF